MFWHSHYNINTNIIVWEMNRMMNLVVVVV